MSSSIASLPDTFAQLSHSTDEATAASGVRLGAAWQIMRVLAASNRTEEEG
jgi:hypothetical protein